MASFTTLSNVKTYLREAYDPSMDDLITLLITRISDLFENSTDRTFDSTAYYEWLDGTGEQELALKQYPIIALRRVVFDTVGAGDITNTTTNATIASVTILNGSMSLSRVVSGVADTETLTLSDYATLTDLSTAITALAKDWTFSVTSAYSLYPSVQLRPGFLGDCLDPSKGYLEIASAASDPVDIKSGNAATLHSSTGFPAGHQNIFVDYTAGYATLPEELTHLITNMVVWSVLQSGQDLNMKRERLDNYEYEREVREVVTNAFDQYASEAYRWIKRGF